MAVYEMLWDCAYCGTRKLLGKTHRFCPGCGAPQDPTRRYFPSDEDKVLVENHEYVGADRLCGACGSAMGARAAHCTQCGSPMEGTPEVQRVADGPPGSRPSREPRRLMPCRRRPTPSRQRRAIRPGAGAAVPSGRSRAVGSWVSGSSPCSSWPSCGGGLSRLASRATPGNAPSTSRFSGPTRTRRGATRCPRAHTACRAAARSAPTTGCQTAKTAPRGGSTREMGRSARSVSASRAIAKSRSGTRGAASPSTAGRTHARQGPPGRASLHRPPGPRSRCGAARAAGASEKGRGVRRTRSSSFQTRASPSSARSTRPAGGTWPTGRGGVWRSVS
jgi:hypothetical protein